MSLAYVLFVAYALAGMMTASRALTEMAGYCETIQALLSPRVRVSLYEVTAWLFLTVAASWPFFALLPLVVRFRRLPTRPRRIHLCSSSRHSRPLACGRRTHRLLSTSDRRQATCLACRAADFRFRLKFHA